MIENSSKLISIIVPVYNVADYLERCVESLVLQTYLNLEIILVDDGSTDQSGEICEELAKSDERIHVFHKKNGGLSDARNYGIEHCSGEFITFVDSDDRIDLKACENLVNTALLENSDIVIGCIIHEYSDGTIVYDEKIFENEITLDGKEAVKNILEGKGYSACGKLYRKNVFDKIRFPKGKLDEDFATAYKIFYESSKVTYITEYVYFYFKRSGSIMKSPFSLSKLDFVHNAEDAVSYIKNMTNNAELKDRAEALLCNRLDMVIHLIIFDENRKKYKKELKQLVKQLRKKWYVVLTSKYINFKDKLVMISEIITPELYRGFKIR